MRRRESNRLSHAIARARAQRRGAGTGAGMGAFTIGWAGVEPLVRPLPIQSVALAGGVTPAPHFLNTGETRELPPEAGDVRTPGRTVRGPERMDELGLAPVSGACAVTRGDREHRLGSHENRVGPLAESSRDRRSRSRNPRIRSEAQTSRICSASEVR